LTVDDRPRTSTEPSTTDSKVFASLVGVLALITLFQGVMAGVFVRDDKERDARASFIDAHAWGAHVGTVLAIATAVFVIVRMRQRTPLVVGSVLLALSFLGESYLGGLIRDNDAQSLTPIHVPLAMAITGLTVWLSLKGVQLRKGNA
jgi:FtsH-binding integral membrane protein